MMNNNTEKQIREGILDLTFDSLTSLASIMCSDDATRAYISLVSYQPVDGHPGKTKIGVNGAAHVLPMSFTPDEVAAISDKLADLGAQKNEFGYDVPDYPYDAKKSSSVYVTLDNYNILFEQQKTTSKQSK